MAKAQRPARAPVNLPTDAEGLFSESSPMASGPASNTTAATAAHPSDVQPDPQSDLTSEGASSSGSETSAQSPIIDSADDFEAGRKAIRAALATMPASAGVYRMLDDKNEVLYVGKAKNLTNRVSNYVSAAGLSTRILRMIARTRAMEIVTTRTEVEALLLESNLIKRLRPRFNILLRDDKSFPYIFISGDQEWARITKHRGARNRKGQYFGPFASAGAVNRTLNTLQKLFPLRSCSDSIFSNRTRPCLQYQIRRCTGPCVDRISHDDYDKLVRQTQDFLSGRSRDIQGELSAQMTEAAERLDYESAAQYRDRLRALAHIQSHQGINVSSVSDADVIAIEQRAGQSCVQVFFFRAGQNWGNRSYFPSHDKEQPAAAVLAAFLGQFYDDKPPPKEILVNLVPTGADLIAKALQIKADRKVRLSCPQRGARRDLITHAAANAKEALVRRLSESATQTKLLASLGDLLGMDSAPERLEIYDNSHIQGSHAIGAMVVAGPDGFIKNAYRKFNIKSENLTPGDDYAMMREVLHRRFSRLIKADNAAASAESASLDQAGEGGEAAQDEQKNRRIAGVWPDLVLIDGGLGHLNATLETFADLGIGDLPVAAIAKGPDRNAGRERIFLPGQPALEPGQRDPVMYFIQRLRDEAHRYAIAGHRNRRARAGAVSALDEIPGIGPKRKRALLNHFGSVREIERAALPDLQALDGVSDAIARKIYDFFRPEA